jgi:hypothetical protein
MAFVAVVSEELVDRPKRSATLRGYERVGFVNVEGGNVASEV